MGISVRFWMYIKASCENQKQDDRQRGKQIINISFQIDPNVYELLLEIWSLRQILVPPTAAQILIWRYKHPATAQMSIL